MALVKCPECGREKVSDTAESCPDCGYNIKKHFQKIRQAEDISNIKSGVETTTKEVKKTVGKMKKPLTVFAVLVLIAIVAVIAIIIIPRIIVSNNPFKGINKEMSLSKAKLLFGEPDDEDDKSIYVMCTWEDIKFADLEGELGITFWDADDRKYSEAVWLYFTKDRNDYAESLGILQEALSNYMGGNITTDGNKEYYFSPDETKALVLEKHSGYGLTVSNRFFDRKK